MYIDFKKWLNEILKTSLPDEGAAVAFNLYENPNSLWSIQLIVSSFFDEDDEDWACDEIYTTGENLYTWHQEAGWEEILNISKNMISNYLREGDYIDELTKYDAIAVGFVDGDLEILYRNNE